MTETIHPTDTAGDLLTRLADAGAHLLVATLDALEAGEVNPQEQPTDGVSHAPKITVDDVRIDWTRPAFAVDRLIRGASPAPGAWTTFRGERLKVLGSRLTPPPEPTDQPDDARPGTLHVTKKQVFVTAAGGRVELTQVQPQGKKAMAAADWARGTRIDAGETLGE